MRTLIWTLSILVGSTNVGAETPKPQTQDRAIVIHGKPTGYRCGPGGKLVLDKGCTCATGRTERRDSDGVAVCAKTTRPSGPTAQGSTPTPKSRSHEGIWSGTFKYDSGYEGAIAIVLSSGGSARELTLGPATWTATNNEITLSFGASSTWRGRIRGNQFEGNGTAGTTAFTFNLIRK